MQSTMKNVAMFLFTALFGFGAFAQVTPNSALFTACPGLKVHKNDVVLSAPKLEIADLTTQRELGWKKVFNFTATVSDKPANRLANEFKATGNVCIFAVEAEKQQVVAVSKRSCMAVCKDKLPTGKLPYIAYYGVAGDEQLMR